MRKLVIACAIAFLAACSGSNDGPTTTVVTQPDLESRVQNAQDVIDMLEGHGFTLTKVREDKTEKAPWIAETYDFRLNSQEAHLVTFTDMDGLASWTEMLAGFGGTAVASTTDPWAIQIGNTDVMKQRPEWKALAVKVAAALEVDEVQP